MTKSLLAIPACALALAQPATGALADDCTIRMSKTGGMVTIQGVVDAADWSAGRYDLILEVSQGGNRSLSRQGGSFARESATADGKIVLSTSTVYVAEGGRLAATLAIDDGTRQATCAISSQD